MELAVFQIACACIAYRDNFWDNLSASKICYRDRPICVFSLYKGHEITEPLVIH